MLKVIKRFIGKQIYGYKYDQSTYEQYLRDCGIIIGKGLRLFDPRNTIIDTQNPYLVSIGDNVRITSGVKVLTHDYSWSVIAGIYNEILGSVGRVIIGNNVFVGVNSVILRNTEIGDNVIIGAGSVCAGRLESGYVYAGVPAKKICTIKQYYERNKELQHESCMEILETAKRIGANNDQIKDMLREYFWIWANREDDILEEHEGLMKRTGYGESLIENYYNTNATFDLKEYL